MELLKCSPRAWPIDRGGATVHEHRHAQGLGDLFRSSPVASSPLGMGSDTSIAAFYHGDSQGNQLLCTPGQGSIRHRCIVELFKSCPGLRLCMPEAKRRFAQFVQGFLVGWH